MSDAEIGYDVVVVGSGAAGFAAAITARLRGLTALIVEKTDHYGGSTALSGGAIWVPGNFHLDAAGLGDTYEKARAYLDATVGDRVPGDRKDAYLRHGPRMVREFHDRTAVRFMYTPGYSDYFPEALGGMAQGRSAEPCVVDLKELGPLARDLRRAGLPTYGLTMTSYDFRFLNMVARTWAASAGRCGWGRGPWARRCAGASCSRSVRRSSRGCGSPWSGSAETFGCRRR